MRARLSISDTTTPLVSPALAPEVVIDPSIDPWLSKDSPELRRLISLGMACFGLWFFFNWGAPALSWAFPDAGTVRKTELQAATHSEEFVAQAHSYWVLGQWYDMPLPASAGGGIAHARYRGNVHTAQNLPSLPAIGDMYYCLGDGNCWIWMVAPGATVPSWVDP